MVLTMANNVVNTIRPTLAKAKNCDKVRLLCMRCENCLMPMGNYKFE